MKTKREVVVQEACIWAVPVQEWQRDQYPEGQAFYYSIYAGASPYQSGSVNVCTIEVSGMVPAGVNLLERAVATLEEKKATAYKNYMKEVAAADKQIQGLMLLGHDSSGDDDWEYQEAAQRDRDEQDYLSAEE
jgi:hypothetical protein